MSAVAQRSFPPVANPADDQGALVALPAGVERTPRHPLQGVLLPAPASGHDADGIGMGSNHEPESTRMPRRCAIASSESTRADSSTSQCSRERVRMMRTSLGCLRPDPHPEARGSGRCAESFSPG